MDNLYEDKEDYNISIFNQNKIEEENNIYCCPYCPRIPELLHFNEVDNNIVLLCPQHGQMIIGIHDYLESMSQILELKKVIEESKCSIHNSSFYIYCKTCEKNLCFNCNQNKLHLNHIKYKINDVYPNCNEITLVTNKMNLYKEEKNKILKKLENINDKIKFYDMILNSIYSEKSSYLRSINLKHLIYGPDIDLDKLSQDITYNPQPKNNNIKYNIFINDNMIDLLDKKKELNLLYQNTGEEFLYSIFNNSLMNIIKDNDIKIKRDITFLNSFSLDKLKIINLKGNKINSLYFLSNKKFNNLEFLCLNDNDIKSIDSLNQMNAPLIKELYLSKNKIDSIKVFEEMKMNNLQILWLSDNNITSIDSFKNSNLIRLERLGINKNKIQDISVFKYAKFPLLKELYINDNNIDFQQNINKEIIEKLEKKIDDFYY